MEGVVLWYPTPTEDRLITASEVDLITLNTALVLVLKDGKIIKTDVSTKMVESNTFTKAAWSIPTTPDGYLAQRPWRGYSEFGTSELLSAALSGTLNRREQSQWASEAMKRFVIPLTCLVDALLGIGILMRAGPSARRSIGLVMPVAIILAGHSALCLGTETLVGANPIYSFLLALLVALEAALGIVLIVSDRTGEPGRPRNDASRARQPARRPPQWLDAPASPRHALVATLRPVPVARGLRAS